MFITYIVFLYILLIKMSYLYKQKKTFFKAQMHNAEKLQLMLKNYNVLQHF